MEGGVLFLKHIIALSTKFIIAVCFKNFLQIAVATFNIFRTKSLRSYTGSQPLLLSREPVAAK